MAVVYNSFDEVIQNLMCLIIDNIWEMITSI